MSIEQLLERIAVAVEQNNELLSVAMFPQKNTSAQPVPAVAVPAPTTSAKRGRTPAVSSAAPAAAVVAPAAPVVAETMFDEPSGVAAQTEVTYESLVAILRRHADAVGIDHTKALMIKYGADKTTPKVGAISKENWAICFETAEKDIEALTKKVK